MRAVESVTKVANARKDHARLRQLLVNLADVDLKLVSGVVLGDSLNALFAGNKTDKDHLLDAPLLEGLYHGLSGATSGNDGVQNESNVVGLFSLGKLVVVLDGGKSGLFTEETQVKNGGLSGGEEVQERVDHGQTGSEYGDKGIGAGGGKLGDEGAASGRDSLGAVGGCEDLARDPDTEQGGELGAQLAGLLGARLLAEL